MFKKWLALLGSALVVGGAPALAQTPSEATRWLVPLGIAGDAAIAKAARISAYNVGARPARVVVVTMLDGQRRNSAQILLQPGRSTSFPEIVDRANFAIVVSDEPIVASATIDRATTSVVTPFKVAEPGDPGQVTLQNQQNNQVLRGYFTPYTLISREDARALPLNCQGAASEHFACSIHLPFQKGEAVGPWPTASAAPTPPPRPAEPRVTRPSIPGDARRPDLSDRSISPSPTRRPQ